MHRSIRCLGWGQYFISGSRPWMNTSRLKQTGCKQKYYRCTSHLLQTHDLCILLTQKPPFNLHCWSMQIRHACKSLLCILPLNKLFAYSFLAEKKGWFRALQLENVWAPQNKIQGWGLRSSDIRCRQTKARQFWLFFIMYNSRIMTSEDSAIWNIIYNMFCSFWILNSKKNHREEKQNMNHMVPLQYVCTNTPRLTSFSVISHDANKKRRRTWFKWQQWPVKFVFLFDIWFASNEKEPVWHSTLKPAPASSAFPQGTFNYSISSKLLHNTSMSF